MKQIVSLVLPGLTILLLPQFVSAQSLVYIHSDHLGSTALATDTSGRLVSKQNYYPYGTTRSASDSLPTEKQYTGQVSDTDSTGLYYYNARYYNPSLAKFTQADSLGSGLNLYAYVNNDPSNQIDPSGHQNCDPEDFYCRHLPEKGPENPELAGITEDLLNNPLIVPAVQLSNPLVQTLSNIPSQYTAYWAWIETFHFMKHAPDAGYSVYQIKEYSVFINNIINDAMAGNGTIVQSFDQAKQTVVYYFTSSRQGQQWTAEIAENGNPITVFNTGLRNGTYSVREAVRYFNKSILSQGNIVSPDQVSQSIRDNWLDKTPTLIKYIGWQAGYRLGSLGSSLSKIQTPVILAPTFMFTCDGADDPACMNNYIQ